MTFEEALFNELSAVTGVERVYPLVAQQDGKMPFVIYRKNGIQYPKVFDGIIKKTDAAYTLSIVAERYATTQEIYNRLLDLFIGFFNREVGSLITNIDFEHTGDKYDPETGYYITDTLLKVSY